MAKGKNMARGENFESEKKKSFGDEKQLALEELTPFLENLSDEMLDRPYMSVGPDTFTLRQIIKEIEEATEYGRLFVQMLTDHRLELAEREDEFNGEPES